MAMVFCRGCGKEIHETATSCPSCGARQSTTQGKNRVAAAAIAFFLGGIGGHKFYLGKIGQGVLYLVFCWTLIPALISFIEMIRYLCMSDATFDKTYN